MKLRIFLTGATGRLGSVLMPLWSESFEVVPVGRSRNGDHPCLEDLAKADCFLDGDVLIHAAWSSVPATAETHPEGLRDTDLPILKSLLDGIRDSGKRVHFMFFSSGSVYGECRGRPSRETDPTAPVSQYARGKLRAEEILTQRAVHDEFSATVLRISNAYGFPATNRPQGLIAVLIRSALEGTPFEIWGSEEAKKDYIHVNDIASAVTEILSSPPPIRSRPAVCNVASGASASVRELIDQVGAVSGVPLVPSSTGSAKLPWDLERNLLDVSRMQETLGWSAKWNLEEGLAREWQRLSSS